MNTLQRMRSDGSTDDTFRLDVAALNLELPGYQFTEAFQVAPDGTIFALLHLYLDHFGAIAILGDDGSILRTFRLTIGSDRGFSLLVEPDGHLVLGNGSKLWRIDPVAENFQRLSARLEGLSEWEGLKVLGIHGNNVLVRSDWRRPALFWPLTSRLLKIPLNSSPSAAIIIEPDDDDDWLELTPVPPIPTAAPEGRNKRIRIQRRGDVRQPAAVTVSTGDITAKSGEDYVPVKTRLEFESFETEKIVPITIISDGQRELEETFEVVLTEAIGTEAIASPMRIRIEDPTARFQLNAVCRLKTNQVEISYHWPKRHSYQLQWSDDFITWRELPAIPAYSEHGLRVIDEHPLSAKARFYRLWRE